jgi:IS1 family transposase
MLGDLQLSMSGNKPLFVSDELSHYATVLRELYSHKEPVPRTGKRGRPVNSKQVIDYDLDYATVKKTRAKGHIVKVERSVVYGTKSSVKARLKMTPSNTINTSYVERSNLSWRTWDAHLARKSLTFAKSNRWLEAKLSICIVWYNFVRPHATLSKNSIIKPARVTPAMAYGLTSRPWTLYDIFNGFRCVN